MLREIYLDENQKRIILKFEPKNTGKYRLKKLAGDKISSTYSETIKKEKIGKEGWYLEWQISYYIETYYIEEGKVSDSKIHSSLYIKKSIELIDEENNTKKEVYPYELSTLLCKALEISLLDKTYLDKLIEWINSIKDCELLDNFIKPCICKQNKDFKVKDMKFTSASVKLPFLIYENSDRTWIEIIWQKQQYGYSFQPMVYFCIPKDAFNDGEYYEWRISSNNVETITNLFKVFALTSKKHKSDVLKIIIELSGLC